MLPDQPDPRETWDLQDQLVLKVIKAQLAQLVQLVIRVLQDQQVQPDLRVSRLHSTITKPRQLQHLVILGRLTSHGITPLR